MGYEPDELVVRVWLSTHQDEREQEHNRLWNDLTERVSQIVAEPQYADLRPEVNP